MSGMPVTSISVTYNVALVTIYMLPYDTRLISDIFNAVAQKSINIDMIQSPPYRAASVSFSLPAKLGSLMR